MLALTCARMHTSAYWTSVFEGEGELGKLSFALACAGDAEYMRVPDNRMALDCPYNCRMKILIPVMLTVVAVLACSGERGPQPTDLEQIAPGQVEPIVLAPAFGGLTFERPVALVFPGDDDDRALVVEQPGRVLLLTGEDETWSATEFLDITDRVNDRGNEEGLLGLALDPDFESNGRVLRLLHRKQSPKVCRFEVYRHRR